MLHTIKYFSLTIILVINLIAVGCNVHRIFPPSYKPKINMYTTSFCPFGKKMLDFLKEQQLEFTVHYIDKSSEKRKELMHKVKTWKIAKEDLGFPLVEINGNFIIGYYPNQVITQMNRNYQRTQRKTTSSPPSP